MDARRHEVRYAVWWPCVPVIVGLDPLWGMSEEVRKKKFLFN